MISAAQLFDTCRAAAVSSEKARIVMKSLSVS